MIDDNSYAIDLWSQMQGTLETEVSAITYDVWLKPLEAYRIVDGKLVLLAPTLEVRGFVSNRYFELIKKVMQQHNSLLYDLEILDPAMVESEYAANPLPKSQAVVAEVSPSIKYETVVLNRKYTFETFVEGKSNQLLYATAQAVAEGPGSRYNPLFIYGGVGLGKTHIMHAIGNYIINKSIQFQKDSPVPRVLYVSSEQFTNEFIEGIRFGNQQTNSFREKYRKVDVLMVDDVQFFANKDSTVEEFFHTFNELYNLGKQIVLTSDRPPKEIMGIHDRLKSRFECGIMVDVQSPDLETRVAILRKKAQLENQYIPDDIIYFMAERINNNIRELEGLFNKVVLLAQLEKKPPNTEIVETALLDFKDKSKGAITMEDIIDCTCKYFKISKTEVLGKKKTKEIAETRQMCMYIITELLDVPLASIGAVFGGRDHTTVMHARNKVAGEYKENERTKTIVQDIKAMMQ